MIEESLGIAGPQLTDTHPRILGYTINLARVRIARGDGAATESSLRHVLTAREHLYPLGDWRIAEAQSLLSAGLMARARYGEAKPLMLAAARRGPSLARPGFDNVDNCLGYLLGAITIEAERSREAFQIATRAHVVRLTRRRLDSPRQ